MSNFYAVFDHLHEDLSWLQHGRIQRGVRACHYSGCGGQPFFGSAFGQKDAEPKKNVTLEELLPQINVKEGVANCSGNRDLYSEILNILCETASEQLTNLKGLKEQKDYPNFIIEIHGMKSQLLNIGYSSLAEKARALEMAGRESRYEYIEAHLDEFVESYEKLVKQLEDANKQITE